jgi:hypothetical protein
VHGQRIGDAADGGRDKIAAATFAGATNLTGAEDLSAASRPV